MKSASRINNTSEYFFSKKLEEIRQRISDGHPVINLGIGNPDISPPKEIRESMIQAIGVEGSFMYQPYKGIGSLRKSISDWYLRIYGIRLDPDVNILPLLGSKEGIGYISLAYLEAGDKVLIPDPGYPAYAAAAKLAEADISYYQLKSENNWYPDMEELEQMISPKTKLMWVNYPHMPSTQPASEEVFHQMITLGIKHNILICNDNPYSLILNDKPKSLLSIKDSHKVAMELNSLSKSHNLAGARIGMLTGANHLLDPVFKVQSNFSSGMFEPIQKAAIAALSLSREWTDTLNREYSRRRKKVFAILDNLKCTYRPDGSGLFVWARVPSNYNSGEQLSNALLYEADIFITPGIIFGTQGKDYVRISLCASIENYIETLKRLKKWNKLVPQL